jgi:hypothetical protein
MDIYKGDRLLVNVAAFIGSMRRSEESIPCCVLAIQGDLVEVQTEAPYREFSLWVHARWIDGVLEPELV